MAELRGVCRNGALAALIAVCLGGAAAAQESARDQDTADDIFAAGLSDEELSRASGLGVATAIDDSNLGDGNFAIGANNSSAQARAEGKAFGVGGSAGDIRDITLSGIEGMNVFQNATGHGNNQLVSQAIIIKFIDVPTP